MKWSIETIRNGGTRYNAGLKPRQDVCEVLTHNGYEQMCLPLPRFRMPIISPLATLLHFARNARRIAVDDEVVIQYPLFYYNSWLEMRVMTTLCRRCKHVTLLVHDIATLRTTKPEKAEERLFSLPHRLVLHTPAMIQAVQRQMPRVTAAMTTLGFFDYLTTTAMQSLDETLAQRATVAFAGSLSKSSFINQLHTIGGNIQWRLYGAINEAELTLCDKVGYCGKFDPNNPSLLKGGWGLVWDGADVDNCNDLRGQYLRYNSPHKCSLYLVRGLPLIVWKKSAIAPMVKEQNIGITVDSLHDIETTIAALPQERLAQIIAHAQRLGQDLRKGKSFSRLL